MATQTIVWTALPNGVATAGAPRLRVSVFVAPRLRSTAQEGEQLRLWPDWLAWTDRVRTVTFRVQFEGGPALDATIDRTITLEPALWGALFRAGTFVRAHEFDDYAQRTPISYPVRNLHGLVRDLYSETGFFFPNETEFTSGSPGAEPLLFEWSVPWNAETEARARADTTPGRDLEGQALTERALLFHRPPPQPEAQLPGDEAGFADYMDFHQALAALGDYPALMRALGLVVDLTVPAADVPTAVRSVRVLPAWQPAAGVGSTDATPRTGCAWDGTRFAAAPSTPAIADGLLVLGQARHDAVQVDVDGALHKLVNQAVNRLNRGFSTADPSRARGLPTVRNAGITVTELERADGLKTQFARARANNGALESQQDVRLSAEDLVRGFRVDVWEGRTQRWRSLCERVGTYLFEGAAGGAVTRTIRDEGVVQLGVTEPALSDAAAPPTADMYIHEALFRWEGWSLVAPRPGRSVSHDADPASPPEDFGNQPLTPFKLRVGFIAAPGSLPRLRFGQGYRFRARIVDLAGNSVALSDAPDLGLPQDPRDGVYLRYDPVPAPAVVLRSPITEQTTPGEALERLVVRTANTDPSKDALPGTASAERHIVPPRASVLLTETHELLDAPGGAVRGDAATHALLSRKDAGQLAVDPATNMPVEPAPQLVLQYLPDPLSRGAAFRDLPGAPAGSAGRISANGALVFTPLADVKVRPGSAALISWGGAWPDPRPLRFVVRDGSGPPRWDAAARVLTVEVPKGQGAIVPFSSFLDSDDLKLMGVWQWIREYVEERIRRSAASPDGFARALDTFAGRLATATQYALEGGHVMLTPPRRLVLVHAVQQPLGRPAWRELRPGRNRNATTARLFGELRIHAASTGHVDLLAAWQEHLDRRDEAAPRVVEQSAHVARFPLTAVDIRDGNQPVATYNANDDALRFEPAAAPQHAFGDTKHRVIRYRAVSTSRFGEYFTPDAAGGFTRTSDEITVRIPASARPAVPRVRYVVPAFGWQRHNETNLIASRRLGGGLRVVLDRPWFSSGEGELLGVVLLPFFDFADDAQRERFRPFVSQRAADPIVSESLQTGSSVFLRLPNAVTRVRDVILPEIPGIGVDVAAHAVAYDAERGLWYSDILVDQPGYYPFVRLALARYQPDALPDVQLSRVVLADFVQPAPGRSAVMTFDPYLPELHDLTVSAAGYRGTADLDGAFQPGSTAIEVSVEMRRPDIGGDLGWVPAPAGAAVVVVDQQAAGLDVLWRGRITLPAERTPGQFRIVIKEFEPWFDDAAAGSIGAPEPSPKARRLVYAETIVL